MAISKLAKTEPPRTEKGPNCTVCRALDEMPKAEADGLRAMLADPAWSFKAITEAIRDDPDPHPDVPAYVREIAHQTFGRHATGGCSARLRLRPRR